MLLVADLTPADIDDPQPGTVIAGRIEAITWAHRSISAPCWSCRF
jgi:hypothetical protein